MDQLEKPHFFSWLKNGFNALSFTGFLIKKITSRLREAFLKTSTYYYPKDITKLLSTCFRLNGVVDVIRVENLMRDEQYGHHVGFYEVDEKQSLDIDTPMDYKICEIMMSEAKNEI